MGLHESFVLGKQNVPVDKGLEWMLRAKGVDCAIYLLFAPPDTPCHPTPASPSPCPPTPEADLCGPHPVSSASWRSPTGDQRERERERERIRVWSGYLFPLLELAVSLNQWPCLLSPQPWGTALPHPLSASWWPCLAAPKLGLLPYPCRSPIPTSFFFFVNKPSSNYPILNVPSVSCWETDWCSGFYATATLLTALCLNINLWCSGIFCP